MSAPPGTSGLAFDEPLLFERSRRDRPLRPLEPADVPRVEPAEALSPELVRDDLEGFP